MSKEQPRPRAVDEQIKTNLKERDPYAFTGARESGHTDTPEEPEDGVINTLLRMSDAALEGRLAYFEGESIFCRSDKARAEAKLEMSRTQREIARRKVAARNEANKTFAGQAANDLEADHVVEPARAA